MTAVHLTNDELNLLIEALDSHEYCQLSDERSLNSGHHWTRARNDPDFQKRIRACRVLQDRLLSEERQRDV